MKLNLDPRPDVRNELNIKRILLITAGIGTVLTLAFFASTNFLSRENALAKHTSDPETKTISGNASTKSNKNIMKSLSDGDTLELTGDLYIDEDCDQMSKKDVIINMKGGDIIFAQDKGLYLGEDAVILCRSGYHLKVEDVGVTGCDDMTIGDDEDDDSDQNYDCGDPSCSFHKNSHPNSCTFSVTSTNGYTVWIEIEPTKINTPNNCQNGYNYTVDLKYHVSFTGSNIPNSLYTLQGNLVCDGDDDNFLDLPNSGGTGTTTTANSWRSQHDCHSIKIDELCESIEIEIEGPGISSQTISLDLGEQYNTGDDNGSGDDEEDDDDNNSGSSGGTGCTFTVNSTNGYTVTAEFTVATLNIPGSCTYGYNWTADIDYNISFSGTNVPSSMYTLQANLIVDGDNDNFFNLPNSGGTGTATTSNSWRSSSDCGTITISGFCEQIALTIQGPNLSSRTVTLDLTTSSGGGNDSGDDGDDDDDDEDSGLTDDDNESRIYFGDEAVISPYGDEAPISFCLASHSGWDNGGQTLLPVELISFTANPSGDQVELRWVTASEENNSHFDIERSSDGVTFQKIGQVTGNGTTMNRNEYVFLDGTAPKDEHYIYYRLHQFDFNGDDEFHPLISFSWFEADHSEGKVYPNPADQELNVELPGQVFNISIVDQTGRTVFTEEGVNERKTIITSDYPRGYYVMTLYNDRIRKTFKVLVRH
ncbi:MAG: T9SS type A sorting domain-containing protein [Bacteroidetes bacterium]|nr:T9SS type A sorting domain-containing protein [Bacteroidota bacterium]